MRIKSYVTSQIAWFCHVALRL